MGGIGPALLEVLQGAAESRANKLTHGEYETEATWSTRRYMPFVMQHVGDWTVAKNSFSSDPYRLKEVLMASSLERPDELRLLQQHRDQAARLQRCSPRHHQYDLYGRRRRLGSSRYFYHARPPPPPARAPRRP